MKHLIILLVLAFLLTGCSIAAESDNTGNGGFQTTETTSYGALEPDSSGPIADVTSALTTDGSVSSESDSTATTVQTDTAPSMSIETAEPDIVSTTAAISSTVTTATTPTAATTSQPVPQTTTGTATIATPAAPDTTGTVSEETKPPVEENQYDLPVFIEYDYNTPKTFDGAQREYLLVTVIPEKIYWNDPKRFDGVKEGSPLNILIPAVMYDTIKNSDSVVLRFDVFNSFPNSDERLRFYPKYDSDKELTYDNVMVGSGAWMTEDLFTIKDGVLTELEITDEMRRFIEFWDGTSSIELDYDEFSYGMTVEEFDTFYDDTHRKIVEMEEYAKEVREELGDDSYSVGCDLVSYSYFLEGTVMRVRLK